MIALESIERTEVLVIGAGIAGRLAALGARRRGAEVLLAHVGDGASPFVLGANVAASGDQGPDAPQTFLADVLRGGYGLSEPGLVEALVENGPPALADLLALGVPFARDGEGGLRRRHLSGNTWPRSAFVEEGTGRAVLLALGEALARDGVDRRRGWRALALVPSGDGIAGAILHDRRADRLVAVAAPTVVLAAGGIGRIYADSTYPADIGGDAYVLALEAGARLIDMEFVQFEPTVTVVPQACRGMEMPTAMLGDGAVLRNASGERFMFRENPEHGEKRIEKARMALAIQREIDEGRGLDGGGVRFDTTPLAPEILEGYVGHVRRLRAAGCEPSRLGPLVRPAAHSLMGGVRIDRDCASDVPGLIVAGEAAGGLHGASRLAGNGGGEIIAFGRIAGAAAARAGRERGSEAEFRALAAGALDRLVDRCRRPAGASAAEEAEALGALMTRDCGIRRHGGTLARALEAVRARRRAWSEGPAPDGIAALDASRSVVNGLVCAEAILAAALLRTESRGAHQRVDRPATDAGWQRHIAVRLAARDLTVSAGDA